MKKVVTTLAVITCIVGSAVSVSASSTDTQNSGGIDLDQLINQQTVSQSLRQSSSVVTIAAEENGGGTFNVVWGLDRHTAYYNHPSKEHLASVSNSSTTIRSEWQPAEIEASAWIKSSLWGNKANWQTR
jgi:lactococcin 972 family bacteriocin